MKVRHAFLGIGVLLAGLVLARGASSVTYQNTVDLQFTFNPVLSISLSSADLLIPNLNPGTSDYSNTITVSVNTTSIAGYTLSAKVGNGTTYFNDNLINRAYFDPEMMTYDYVFDSIDSSSTLANFQNNTWGYTLGAVSSSSVYQGLSYGRYTTINATTNAAGTAASSGCVTTCAGTNNTSFTIGAKASATQRYGDYDNVIVFTVVGNEPPEDLDIMQEVATWKSEMSTGETRKVLDSRDNKKYFVTKLADGNIWMTQNLDHDIGSIQGGTYTSANTDLPSGTTWTPSEGSYTRNDIQWWNDDGDEPLSYDPGNVCWDGTLGDYGDYTLDDAVSCSQNGNHYHVGNYYDFAAAVAMDDTSGFNENFEEDVNQSICPAGWRLPKSFYPTGSGGGEGGAKSASNYNSNGTFLYLLLQYGFTGIVDEWTGETYNYGSNLSVWNSPFYYTYIGYWYGYSGEYGYSAYYASSVAEYDEGMGSGQFYLHLGQDYSGYTSYAGPYDYMGRDFGFSIRCVAR